MKKIFTFFILGSSFFTLKAQSGIISTVAGDAGVGYNGDNRQATTANLNQDGGVAVDAAGNIYIADSQNNRIRKVNTSGVITTIAGTGAANFSGDGGQATAAKLNYPVCVRVDTLGNVYFSDAGNTVIRRITPAGVINTVAGNNGLGFGFSGDGGQATAAELNYPVGISLDRSLNLYIADQVNNVIRKVNYSTGRISTVAGRGPAFGGYSGNGGQATAAELDQPTGVAMDNANNLYIADYNNNVIRVVNSGGVISNFAGNTTNGFTNFSGVPTTLELSNPTGVSVDNNGHVYIADAGNAVIWEAYTQKNQMYVIAGIVDGAFSGDGGPAYSAEINYAFDAMPDKNNNLYIADLGNNRIRKITAGCGGDSVTAVSYNYPECHGGTDGFIVAFPNSPFEPYQYLWSNGNTTSQDSIVPAGTYTIQVTDALGCVGTGSVIITQPPAINVSTSNYMVCLNSDVQLSSSASGGVGPLSYTWDSGNTTDTVTVAPTSDQTYTIYVNDGNGCYDSAMANVTVNPLPSVILNAQIYSVCSTVTVDSLIGSPPGGTYAGPNLTGNIFNPNAAGSGTWNFTYTYTDGNGCTNVGTQQVVVNVCTGIADIDNGGRIAVYPNPANNEFTLQLHSGDAAQMIDIYDITGQQVYEHKFTSGDYSQLSVINTQAYTSGVYFVRVVLQDGTIATQKLNIVK